MTVRVVHVLYSLDTGGMEKGITTVIRHASPRFEHALCCLTRSGAMAKRLPEGTQVVEMRKAPGHSFRFLWTLSRALKRLRPDVVHTRNWPGMDGIVAGRLAGLRIVHGEHGWDPADATGRDPKRRRFRRLFSRWVREYTCVSRDIARWLADDLEIRRPITQIYNGVDTERFRPGDGGAALRAELGLHADAPLVGHVGRLDPIKDHPTLFRAIETLRASGAGAHLLVVGDGPEEARLRALAGDGIHLLGRREDVPRILGALDVFVLNSLNEGISNTILEAMASGRAVVATRVGGNPELVDDGETGRLVPAADADALARAIGDYLDDPDLRRRHGAAARAAATERFGIERMVREYEAVWARVAGGA